MSSSRPDVPPTVAKELVGITHEWTLGTRHWKLFINNRLVGIIPRGVSNEGAGRGPLNLRSQIRRFVTENKLRQTA